jgi:hypothetical protein
MDNLTDTESAVCATREQWARLFIARNPSAHAFAILGAYRHSGLGERLGEFSLDEIQQLQAERGAGGLSPEKLEEQQRAGAERRRKREDERARFLQLGRSELAALPDRRLVRAVFARLSERENRDSSSALPASARRVLLVTLLDADVSNGGFDQYFWNWSDDSIPEVTAALDAMELGRVADIVSRAASLYRSTYPEGIRDSGRAGRDPAFDPLDAEYYAASKAVGRVNGQMARYMRAHLGEF